MLSSVLVTGATGFIASRIIERLLARGHRVRGTVRSPKKPGDIDRLRELTGARERLDLVESDLILPASFDAAAVGCDVVMHTASPYAIDVSDARGELVDPAVNGTREVLAAASRAGSVRRVVLTSSMAAVTDEPDDRVLTEADWNTKSSLDRNPYYYAKTMAERAAWAFMEESKPPFDLVAINPFMVIGPSVTASLNTSNRLLLIDLLKGTYPGILSLTWGIVDVRDVAEAHVRAMEVADAHGRYLCVGEAMSMRQVVTLLKSSGYGGHKLPALSLDSGIATAIIKLAAVTQQKGTGSYLRSHLGRVPRYDTTKIRTELGVTFRPGAETILDTVRDLQRWGHLGN
ncbi:MAG: aldehyde reductase [Acidimicrobiia bacterium]|nr:aldehyde reductase [Acidimicrobiia bacterium]